MVSIWKQRGNKLAAAAAAAANIAVLELDKCLTVLEGTCKVFGCVCVLVFKLI